MEEQQSVRPQYHATKRNAIAALLEVEKRLLALPQEGNLMQQSHNKKSEKHKVSRKDPKQPSIEQLLEEMQMERKKNKVPENAAWTKEDVLKALYRGKKNGEDSDGPLVVTSVVKEKKHDPEREARRVARRARKEQEEKMKRFIDTDIFEDVPKILGKGKPPLAPEEGQKQRDLDDADITFLKLLNSLPELPRPPPQKVIQKSPPLDHTQGSPEKQKAPPPAKKHIQDEVLAAVKDMDGKPSERVQMIPGSLLITRFGDGINIQITVRINAQAGSRLMDIRTECPKYKASRINVDGKWMSIQ